MPRIKRGSEWQAKSRFPELTAKLIAELRNGREFGQPVIEEQQLPRTDALRVTVIWDEWNDVPYEDRSVAILQAYEDAEGKAVRERIALATGFTVPEAYETGLLPFQVLALVRKDDPISAEQCRQAMIEEGASMLFSPDRPQLRFATQEEAEACVKRLVKRLPGSEPIWTISQDVGQIEPRVFA